MIAVDTNILVYAHREDSLFHEQAYACLERWPMEAPWGHSLALLARISGHRHPSEDLPSAHAAESGRAAGPRVHDARIVAPCLQHGVRKLWTADREFGRFRGLNTLNPLVA